MMIFYQLQRHFYNIYFWPISKFQKSDFADYQKTLNFLKKWSQVCKFMENFAIFCELFSLLLKIMWYFRFGPCTHIKQRPCFISHACSFVWLNFRWNWLENRLANCWSGLIWPDSILFGPSFNLHHSMSNSNTFSHIKLLQLSYHSGELTNFYCKI